MAWLVVIGLLGVVLGWLIRGLSAPSRRDLADYEDRAQRADRRLRRVVAERDDENATVLTLRAALKSERQLLDGVARHADVEPEVFRKTISKEYLGRELVVSPASLVDFDFGADRVAEAEIESLHHLLRAKDNQLAEAREQIHLIRSDVESLALAGHQSNGSSTASASPTSQTADPQTVSVPSLRAEHFGTGAASPADRLVGESEATLDLRSDEPVIDLCTRPTEVRSAPAATASAPTDPASAPTNPASAPMDPTSGNGATAQRPGQPDTVVTSVDHLRFLERRAASAQLLEKEVAELRARLADTAVANDDIRSRIEFRRALDRQLAELVEQLGTLQRELVSEKPAPVQDQDHDAVL